ncbi:MAG: bifunctional biotin--[acetyl-CoA-carboxylase] ligase/biotin operon repressor BirA [Haliea sp.]|jgi:BirA family biotin operon repressor/biotin-[acetyl-CoA-carboxylase] ligase|nr:bifunctional biotin--[acetyl-CoA-carboxylase] ligase/biotin operon repressor BirA [Haliea sp.]
MSRSILLPLLADGEFRSGQDLADALGVSRTAVWKQLNKLATETGLVVDSVKGRGYRIPGGVDLLDPEQVKAALSAEAASLLSSLVLLESVDSTNAEALRRAGEGPAAGLVCCAEQQTAGRGRRGRHWVSPFAGNLYLSLVWEFDQGAAALEGLSLAVGVGIARALDRLELPPVQLKWPNDILHEGAKLGGVLLEMTGDAAGACQVVVGVGLNVAMPQAAGDAIDQAWTDVRTLAGSTHPGRNKLLAALLDELLPLVAGFQSSGFAPWRESWQTMDAFSGEEVVLHTGPQQLAGVARGVDERGALLLETGQGVQTVYGGEISLRSAT